jgi:hypothetical protein
LRGVSADRRRDHECDYRPVLASAIKSLSLKVTSALNACSDGGAIISRTPIRRREGSSCGQSLVDVIHQAVYVLAHNLVGDEYDHCDRGHDQRVLSHRLAFTPFTELQECIDDEVHFAKFSNP